MTALKKSFYVVAFLPVITLVYPAITVQASELQSGQQDLVFEVNNSNKNLVTKLLTVEEIQAHDAEFQTQVALKNLLREYLAKRNSPLAACADTLVDQENMDKILSLGAAESGNGKRYIRSTNNLWGWNGGRTNMGATLCDAVVQMNTNLENYPRRSVVKYADMSYADMCGLYKQPCKEKGNHHWVRNNQAIVNDMTKLRAEASQIAVENIRTLTSPTIGTATNSIELAVK